MKINSLRNHIRLGSLILLIIGYALFISRILNNYIADVSAASSREYLTEKEFDKALEVANRAVKLNPNRSYYYRIKAQAILFYSLNKFTYLNSEVKKEVFENIGKAKELNLINLATLRNNIPLYYYLALDNLRSFSEDDSNLQRNYDEIYLSEAKEEISYLKNTYSNDAGVLVSIAHYERKLGLTVEYSKTIEMIRNLRPDLLDWHPLLQ